MQNRRFYIVEEFIDGDFVKCLHNASATPPPTLSPEDMEKALFLVFLQHVIYENATGHMAVISNLQGAGMLLTDPQILTHP
ncbi:hypothetical protein CALVIDRAFT_569770 [Calocera viscosa TUFC12733]|uniref:Alpha-type protein kinase domain-containing protein n=1 Tax=Calocera viscosa (strain TUFC12733) TaxID=1330018 RepID=A0A167FL88_CALVF|nr:hypothetical protein CALVIDRAFT_569770 [Calocera viscosa TUFC12733]